jgi:hypothetical protein
VVPGGAAKRVSARPAGMPRFDCGTDSIGGAGATRGSSFSQ